MTEPIAHDYGTAPFGAHDAVSATEEKHMKSRERAVHRLRSRQGQSAAEAERLVDLIGADVVNRSSDGSLAGRLSEHSSVDGEVESDDDDAEVSEFDGLTIGAVEDLVGDDPAKAQAALDYELSKGDDARSTLVKTLTKLTETTDQP